MAVIKSMLHSNKYPPGSNKISGMVWFLHAPLCESLPFGISLFILLINRFKIVHLSPDFRPNCFDHTSALTINCRGMKRTRAVCEKPPIRFNRWMDDLER
jgi:hypothetical protein